MQTMEDESDWTNFNLYNNYQLTEPILQPYLIRWLSLVVKNTQNQCQVFALIFRKLTQFLNHKHFEDELSEQQTYLKTQQHLLNF